MARPKIAADKLRTATIGVRVSPAEYDQLKAKAAAVNMTPAQWLRSAALSREIRQAPGVNLETRAELARIGINLNQVVVLMHRGQIGEIPGQLAAALREQLQEVQNLLTPSEEV